MTHALQSYSEGRWQDGTGEQRPLESTGHGAAMPQMPHGGPGRAGGGEELGWLRAVRHYLQRTAVQGHPELLATLAGEGDR